MCNDDIMPTYFGNELLHCHDNMLVVLGGGGDFKVSYIATRQHSNLYRLDSTPCDGGHFSSRHWELSIVDGV